ncbi:MAG: NAD(P)H-dependent oxidoreductase [Atopobiaceae bacterium]|nr:NAD(P)H-dependent oxidoreductase [Atopobiaceae bacterium]
MNIVIFNGSPRPHGNTAAMVNAYREGAESTGHHVTVFDVCRMHVAGCLACEYCHTKEQRTCIQKDDMQKIYPVLDEADMLVLASPVYYHGLSGQLKCVIDRIYAPGYPRHLRKSALLLSSGSKDVYGGAIYTYRHSFLEWLHLEDMGVFVAAGDENKSPQLLDRLRAAGAALVDPDDHNVARLVIRAGDVEVRAPLNQTQAARDLMNRLPLTVSGVDSGVDYCCGLKEGTFDEAEKQQGWSNGDVSVSDGWFALLHSGQEQSQDYRVMVVAHLNEAANAQVKALPQQVTFELSLEEPYVSARDFESLEGWS